MARSRTGNDLTMDSEKQTEGNVVFLHTALTSRVLETLWVHNLIRCSLSRLGKCWVSTCLTLGVFS